MSAFSIDGDLYKAVNELVAAKLGVALALIWAGVIEAFFSQYHAPVLPYRVKITFGTVKLALLAFFLSRCGRKRDRGRACTS